MTGPLSALNAIARDSNDPESRRVAREALRAFQNRCIPSMNADARSIGLDWCTKHNMRWDTSYSTCDGTGWLHPGYPYEEVVTPLGAEIIALCDRWSLGQGMMPREPVIRELREVVRLFDQDDGWLHPGDEGYPYEEVMTDPELWKPVREAYQNF